MKAVPLSGVRGGAATKNQIRALMAGVDAIEVKATVPDHQIELALDRYQLTIDNGEERYIHFFDTPTLGLVHAGVIARAPRIVGDEHNSTVKFRPVVPAEVPQKWKAVDGFKLEADASELEQQTKTRWALTGQKPEIGEASTVQAAVRSPASMHP